MSPAAWVAASTLLAAALAVWAYGWREEPVPGRTVAAVLRGLALAFLLGGLFLPPIRGSEGGDGAGPVVVLDISASMALPASATGGSRLDSARTLLRALAPARVVLMGDEPATVPAAEALGVAATARRSRLAPALEAAALSGAARAVVLTDGAWDDRPAVEEVVERLALGVREARVAEPTPRLGLSGASAPDRLPAGETATASVELTAGGEGAALPDTVAVELWEEERRVAARWVPSPAPGRSVRVALEFAPTAPEEGATGSGWRTYELRLETGADPLGASDRARFRARITDEAGGAVLVSTDPDWEPGFLLPVLERIVLGGARGYLRVGDGAWLEMGDRPSAVSPEEVRRDASAARLLAVQGDPGSLPAWLAREVEAHPRRLFLPRGTGSIPGLPVRVVAPLEGEWYPVAPPPPGPAARLLAGLAVEDLPPLTALYSLEGGDAPGTWVPLRGRRGRRGEDRPLALAGGEGRRWAVAAGEGYWRWALREGVPRRVYEALVGAVAGWIVEGGTVRPVELEGRPRPSEALGWRVAPGVSGLRVAVRDSAGETVWTGEWEDPSARVPGPVPPHGDASFEATGRTPDGAFRTVRPFRAEPEAGELLPRALPPPLARAAIGSEEAGDGPPGRGRAVWPFVAAALLLCGEWVWRRRIGLR